MNINFFERPEIQRQREKISHLFCSIFRNNDSIKKTMSAYKELKIYNVLSTFLSRQWLICLFIGLIIYLELLYRLWIFKSISIDFIFPILFALSAGALIYIIISLIPGKAAGIITVVLTFLISLFYGIQLIYTYIFQMPLSLVSLGGAGDVLQFGDIIIGAILKNAVAVVLLFAPLIILLLNYGNLDFLPKKPIAIAYALLFFVTSYSLSVLFINLTGDSPASQHTLYYKATSPQLSANKLGLLTTMRLDLKKLIAGAIQENIRGSAIAESGRGNEPDNGGTTVGENSAAIPDEGDNAINDPDASTDPNGNGTGGDIPGVVPEGDEGTQQSEISVPKKPYNVMDIDFDKLLENGQKDSLLAMHKYFSTVEPTATNEYTGMFEGCNLILITAEGFSPYVISPELTPTLYEMSTEGFVFNNFYNPVWWVSTSDGEYVACTGLMPKSGVWSMAHSGKNYMPFAMGNQFRNLGYITKAYHNHTYTYYKRDVSHPNLGYDYKGVGNGLNVKKTWPESDLEMIDVTVDEYIHQQPFHAYYMTVSGHMNYSFGGNQMARKNKEYVEHLPYSDASKAYIACNLELEFALESLVEKLEAAGVAENTVIALSSDHYPYGLPKENIDELAGHEVEKNFELFESTLILWKKGMEPVIVDKPCASLDIIPTLSNLFGLEYDSRLLMGTDILSDAPTLVIFSNRSWITDRAIYNSSTDKITFTDGTVEDKEYVKKINKIVADKFKYSTKILETDYYRKVLP